MCPVVEYIHLNKSNDVQSSYVNESAALRRKRGLNLILIMKVVLVFVFPHMINAIQSPRKQGEIQPFRLFFYTFFLNIICLLPIYIHTASSAFGVLTIIM